MKSKNNIVPKIWLCILATSVGPAIVSVIGSMLGSTALASEELCSTVFLSPSLSASRASQVPRSRYAAMISISPEGHLYAKGADRTPGKEIQIGFESEYTVDELGPLTNFYGPTSEAGISKEHWLRMPLEARMTWIREKVKSIPFGSKDTVLVRLDSNPELGFLPSKLIRDDTGNVEIILAPVSEFKTWQNQVRWINGHFGPGSMQSMVSQPRESFFARDAGSREVALNEDLGYFNFIHELDVLDRMASGAEKFRQDPNKKVMQPFLHPYLGPMANYRHRKMVNTMTDIANGKILSQEELEAIVRREQSFKYIGSTAYRPDIGGPERVSQEIRDAHKSEDLLIDRTARAVYFAQQGRFGLYDFGGLKAFDNKSVFESMPDNVQALLLEVFPVKAPERVRQFPNALQAHETYRNFSYPMKDWRPWLKALDRMDLTPVVEDAQATYIAKLNAIDADRRARVITVDQATSRIQGALAEFALESRLAQTFKEFERSISRKYGGASETLETRRALEIRLQEFQNKWPENVRAVDAVGFKYKDDNQKTSSRRRVIVISTAGLSEAQKNEIRSDYLRVVASHTISFPLKERASHTIVQFEGETYDLGYFPTQAFPQFRHKQYVLPTSKRIEPVVVLSPLEQRRFEIYLLNIKMNFKATLGKFSLEGDPNTNGRLDDNRSPCGNNCTTFVATAPIGRGGESLTELLGGRLTVPWIQQNPGWWGSWVLATASQDRVPLAIYWSPESIENTLERDFAPGSSFQWDFNKK